MLSLLKTKSRKALALAAEFTPEELATVRHEEAPGWGKLPRHIMPFLSLLRLKVVVGSMDCDRTYLELTTRDYGYGTIETVDPKTHAFLVGFTGQRAARSWEERVAKLVELDAVVPKVRHNRRFGYLLLRDPDFAVTKIEGLPGVGNDLYAQELITAYWKDRQLHGGADRDKFDLAQGFFTVRLKLGAGGQAVPEPTRAVEARKVVVDTIADLGRLVERLDDGGLLVCASGLETKAVDELMKTAGAEDRWIAIKKANGVVGARVPVAKAQGGGVS
jgi:hypothetical protein